MTISITITKPNVFDQYGILMVVGTTYTVDQSFGLSLIQAQKATDAGLSLVNPGIGFGAPVNIVYVNAATIAAPTAQMLADYSGIYALDVAPFTQYRSNGTALVAFPTWSDSTGTALVRPDGTAVAIPGPRLRATKAVATRGMVPDTFSSTNKQINACVTLRAREYMTTIQLGLINYYSTAPTAGASDETLVATATTGSYSVEYPIGSARQRITIGGAQSGSISSADEDTVDTDVVTLTTPIPYGALFNVWMYEQNASGVIYNSSLQGNNNAGTAYQNSVFFDAVEVAVSGLADKTLSGTITAANGLVKAPFAVGGPTSRPVIGVLGDSIAHGNCQGLDENGGMGVITRAVGREFAFIQTAGSGFRAQEFLGASTKRRAGLIKWCTHIVSNLGRNDAAAARDAAVILADLEALALLFDPLPFYQCTINYWTASTDSWTTLANQSQGAFAAGNLIALALNKLLRLRRVKYIRDVFDVVTSGMDSGVSTAGVPQIDALIFPAGRIGRTVADGTTTSASNSISSPTAAFTAADTGQLIQIPGAGAAAASYIGMMTYVNATTVTLTNPRVIATASNCGTSIAGTATFNIQCDPRTNDGTHPDVVGEIEASNAIRMECFV